MDIPFGKLLVLHLFANASCADEPIVLAPLTRELFITLCDYVSLEAQKPPTLEGIAKYLRLPYSTPLAGLPYSLMPSVHSYTVGDLPLVMAG